MVEQVLEWLIMVPMLALEARGRASSLVGVGGQIREHANDQQLREIFD